MMAEPGDAGEQGPPGQVGPQGVAGSNGSSGAQGLLGAALYMLDDRIDGVDGCPAVVNITPAVPASTVTATNTTGRDCTVFVKGGTLSVITLASVNTGIAAAAPANTCHVLPLSKGQTIAITYTVAPTWVWVGRN